FARYTFAVDGPAFAEYVRERMDSELRRQGKLPALAQVDVLRQYLDMTGEGELWLRDDGLPLRQSGHLVFPPAEREQVEAEITTDFYDWGTAEAGPTASQAIPNVAGPISLELSNENAQILAQLLFALLTVVALRWLLNHRRSQFAYTTLVSFVILAQLFGPLL